LLRYFSLAIKNLMFFFMFESFVVFCFDAAKSFTFFSYFSRPPTHAMDPLQKLRNIEAEQATVKQQLAHGGLNEAERVALNNRLQGLSTEAAAWAGQLEKPLPPWFTNEWQQMHLNNMQQQVPPGLVVVGSTFIVGRLFKWTPRQTVVVSGISGILTTMMFGSNGRSWRK
jgi:hypothetical protein